MSIEIDIVQMTEEHLPAIQALIKKVYNKHLDIDVLRHKYQTKVYHEFEFLSTVAFYKGNMVGFYGLIPTIFKLGSDRIYMGQTCDSFVHPNFQGQGIHYRLAEFCYDLLRQKGFKGVYAFHSENTFQSCKKLGWHEWPRFQRAHLKVDCGLPLFKAYSKYRWLNSFKRKAQELALAKNKTVRAFINPSHKIGSFGLDYSPEFVTYKNAYDCVIFEIESCRVWLKLYSAIHVTAVSGLTKENCDQVLSALKDLAKQLKTPEIIIQIYPSDPAFEILSGLLDFKDSFRIGYLFFDESLNQQTFHHNYIDMDSVI